VFSGGAQNERHVLVPEGKTIAPLNLKLLSPVFLLSQANAAGVALANWDIEARRGIGRTS
jgi:hypothetical protein